MLFTNLVDSNQVLKEGKVKLNEKIFVGQQFHQPHPLYEEIRIILGNEDGKLSLPATFMPFVTKTLDVHVFPLLWYEAKVVIYDDRSDQFHYPVGKDLAEKGHAALVQSNAYVLIAQQSGVYIYRRDPRYKLAE